MSKIGFIGCGNMGGALLRAASKDSSSEIFVTDFDMAKAKSFEALPNVTAADCRSVVMHSEFLFIAVKPQGLKNCFDEIKDVIRAREDNLVIVSMAAGVSIEKIIEYSGYGRIIRIMPNMPASVGKAVIAAVATESVSEQQTGAFSAFMKNAGLIDWTDEKFFDVIGALSGCGPAFVYLFTEALADGAVACGMPREKALKYAAKTVEGSAAAMLESGKHPAVLKDEVCSPGGTTIEGVRALENGSFRAASMNAVIAAYEKSKKL